MVDGRTRINISLSHDTAERLRQYAFEHHYSCVSQAITQWIWTQKISGEQIRGQMSIAQMEVSYGDKTKRK